MPRRLRAHCFVFLVGVSSVPAAAGAMGSATVLGHGGDVFSAMPKPEISFLATKLHTLLFCLVFVLAFFVGLTVDWSPRHQRAFLFRFGRLAD